MILSDSTPADSKTVLDPNGGYLTFINTFTVEPDKAEALLEALATSTRKTFASKKGFISVNLHMARDRKRVVNYAQWASKEDYEAAQRSPDVAQHVKEIGGMALGYDPVDYDLRYCIPSR